MTLKLLVGNSINSKQLMEIDQKYIHKKSPPNLTSFYVNNQFSIRVYVLLHAIKSYEFVNF